MTCVVPRPKQRSVASDGLAQRKTDSTNNLVLCDRVLRTSIVRCGNQRADADTIETIIAATARAPSRDSLPNNVSAHHHGMEICFHGMQIKFDALRGATQAKYVRSFT